MNLVFPTLWAFAGSLAWLVLVVNAAGGVLEIDVVFPRSNETYAPTDKFPIVFALQNAQLAKHLDPTIRSFVRNGSNLELAFGHDHDDLANANYTTEPYFVYRYLNVNAEGPYELFATTSWKSCNESGDQVSMLGNTSSFGVDFTIKSGAEEVDLVAATAKDEPCSQAGVAISVTDQTRELPPSGDQPARTCAVLASSSPSPTTNPCRVKIDAAVVASMSAAVHAASCKGPNPPADCPKENAVQELAVAGVVCLAAALGAIGFLLG